MEITVTLHHVNQKVKGIYTVTKECFLNADTGDSIKVSSETDQQAVNYGQSDSLSSQRS